MSNGMTLLDGDGGQRTFSANMYGHYRVGATKFG